VDLEVEADVGHRDSVMALCQLSRSRSVVGVTPSGAKGACLSA